MPLRDRIEALPPMARLLPALPAEPPCHLVGGAVRDLLLGLEPVDLDLCVDGDARALARELARRLGGTAREHGAFGTATVSAPGVVFDLARTRRERYERPGALPVVEPAPLSDDLARRDFTVNAMAAPLSGPEAGELVDLHGGVDDLGARTVRVLHAASFLEDPTRLLRAVRYEARLGFRMDPGTEELARAAAASGALATVSGPRVRDELLDLLAEPEVQGAVRRLRKLGLARALHPALDPDARVVAAAAREAPALGAEPGLAALGALAVGLGEDAERWLGGLGLTAGARARAARAATRGPALALALAEPLGGADLHALLRREPPEALAVARALGAPEEPVRRFLDHLRDVRLEVTGRELIAAGVPPSPRLGRALEETLRLKLDGEVSGRDDELRAALQVARAVDGDPR